jgi:predicted RNA-binding protein YlxR (DUF448 family)
MAAENMAASRPRRQRASPKRLPQRTCVGCRSVLPKRQLVRLVRMADGGVALDPTGKAAGRGAYLHDRPECWDKALSAHALDQALKVNLTEADRARLRDNGAQYAHDA